jgi:hypothetical protein
LLEIQEGRAVQLKNGDILTSSGMIYGTHGNNTVFLRSGSPNTVDLNQGESDIFFTMS